MQRVSIISIHHFQNTVTWDTNKLLTYCGNMGPSSELTLKQVCTKKAVLFMLLGTRKKQALLAIDIADVVTYKMIKSFYFQIKHLSIPTQSIH